MKQPTNPFHPGEILLEEFLQPSGITQTAFAGQLGWTRARLNELIKGKRGITAESALDLAEALGTSAKLWMNLQATFDIDQAMKLGANHPMGPLALGDLIGLDVCLAIMDVMADETGDPKYRAHTILKKYVRAGWLGRKSGKGFFDYSK